MRGIDLDLAVLCIHMVYMLYFMVTYINGRPLKLYNNCSCMVLLLYYIS